MPLIFKAVILSWSKPGVRGAYIGSCPMQTFLTTRSGFSWFLFVLLFSHQTYVRSRRRVKGPSPPYRHGLTAACS
ncbi:hypothetical protein HDV57DRAFT_486662 [Trichoderma longibrachiatum]